VLLYELLTGTTPFDRERFSKVGYDELRRILLAEDPPRPSTRLSTLGQAATTISAQRQSDPRKLSQLCRGELDWIVMKALEKDRNRRYETASAFAADVQRYLHDEPVQACPPSAMYRFRKFSRRYKGALTAGVVLSTALVLTVVVLALSTAWVWKENQDKNAALVLAQRRHDKALEAVQRMLTRVADEWVAPIPQMIGVRQRLLEDAAALYTDLIALNPDDARAYHERGWVYNLLARHDQARADYERAATIEPDNAEYHGTIATFFDNCDNDALRDKQRCLHHARRMVELRPTDAEARGMLATAYLSAGQTKEGVAELWKGAELARGAALEHKLLAVVEMQAGNWREAIAHLQQARELPPPDLWVYHRLAEAHLALREDAQALAAADRGVEVALRPSDEPAGPSQFRGRWRGIVAKQPTSEALVTLYGKRADIYLRQKKYAAALADLNNYFDVGLRTSLNPWRYRQRALVHFHLGHYEQALADLDRAIEIKPDDFSHVTWISPHLVASCPDEKFRAGMLALAGKAIERTRGKVGGYFARAHLYAALKQYDNAKADIEKAVELGATNAGALNSLAWWLATFPVAEFRDRKRAVTLATKAVELAPKSWHIRNTLGVAYYRAGEWRDAVVALEKSMEMNNGGISHDWFFLAMAHWRLGDREQGRTWYDKAVAGMDKSWTYPWEEEELKRFRAEAAELLGVKDPPSRKEIAPTKP
jgi:tetratricopeptide (TPR) repeat protein